MAPGLWVSAPAPTSTFAALAPAPVALAEIQAINATVSLRPCRSSWTSCSLPDPGWTAVVAQPPHFPPAPMFCWLQHVLPPVLLAPLLLALAIPLQAALQAAQHETATAANSQHTAVPVQVTDQSTLTQMGVVLQVAGAQFAADIERAAAVHRCVCLRRQSG